MIAMARLLRFCCALAVLAVVAPAAPRADETPGGGAPLKGDVRRGAEIYELCAQCHGAEGMGNAAIEAPSINGLPEWYLSATLEKFKMGGRGTHFDDISGMRMRPMSLTLRSEDDVADVTAYVVSLPVRKPAPQLEGGDAARGAQLYAPCIACHMPDGSGNPALGSPPLKHASDWYLLSQLKKFKSGIRGTNPNDANGALMVGMAQTLPDEQAMKDVIAHIMTFSD